MHRSRVALVLCLITCLGIAACSKKSAGGQGGIAAVTASTPPVGTSTGPSGAPGPSSTGPSSTGPSSSGSPSAGSGSKPSHTSTTNGPPVITVTADPLAAPTVVTDRCPASGTLTGKISVDKGPIDLVYAWRPVRGLPFSESDLHFPAKGPQSARVSVTYPGVTGYHTDVFFLLYIVGPPGAPESSPMQVNVTCGGLPSAPIPAMTHKLCPYTTYFTATISAAYTPQDVTYDWKEKDGTIAPGGTLHFAKGDGPKTVTSPDVTIMTKNLLSRSPMTVRVTSIGGGIVTGGATCSGYKT
jgi:hypothetical protein